MVLQSSDRKDDKDGDWWLSINHRIIMLPLEGAAVAYNNTFLPSFYISIGVTFAKHYGSHWCWQKDNGLNGFVTADKSLLHL